MQTEMKSYYSARATYYDAVYAQPERKDDIAFLSQHLPERLASRKVLEIACGTGFWSQFIAPASAAYTATDGVAEPLALARERLEGLCDDIQIADAYALPSALGSFDAAFAGLWFSHVPIERRDDFFASLHARLTPGARVVLIDNSDVQCKDLPIAETDAHGNTFQHRALRDGSVHRVLKNFPSEDELLALAESLGAKQCQYRMLDNFWYFEYELPDAN